MNGACRFLAAVLNYSGSALPYPVFQNLIALFYGCKVGCLCAVAVKVVFVAYEEKRTE
jgi:hypothetical protein